MGQRQEVGIDVTAHDLAGKELRSVGGELDNLDGKARNAERATGGFGGAFRSMSTGVLMGVGMGALNAITGAFGGLADGIIGGAASFEQYNVQYAVLLKSQEKASERMKELAKINMTTPFKLPELVEADKVLTAFGIRSTKMLRDVGDAAAGTGAPIAELAMTFGRISSGAFGEAFMRLAELGIATRKDLEMQGLKFDKAGSYTGSAEEAMAAVQKIVETRFGGMTEKQSKTLAGQWSNVQDMIGATLRGIGEAAMPLMKGGLQWLLDVGPKIGAQITAGAAVVIPVLTRIGQTVFEAFGTLAPLVSDGLDVARSVLADVATALQPILDAVTPVMDAIEGLFGSLKSGGDRVGGMFDGIGAKLATVYQTIYASVGEAVGQIVPKLAELANAFLAWVGPMIPPLLAQLATFVGAMFDWLVAQVPLVTEKLLAWASAFVDWLAPQLPKVVAQLVVWAQAIFDWVVNTGVPKAADALKGVAEAFIAWVGPATAKLVAQLPSIISSLTSFLGKNLPILVGKLAEWAGAFVGWIAPMVPKMVLALGGMLVDLGVWIVRDALPAFLGWAGDMAGQLIKGMVDGLIGLPGALAKAIGDAFRSISIDVGPLHLHDGNFTIDFSSHEPVTPGAKAYALGGPVDPNVPILVGERGPELFVPGTSGQIIPNHALSGPTLHSAGVVSGGGASVNVNVSSQYFGGSKADARGFARDLYDLLVDEDRRRGGQMFAGA